MRYSARSSGARSSWARYSTVAGGFAGIELYGIGGALMMLLIGSLAVAAADELAPDS